MSSRVRIAIAAIAAIAPILIGAALAGCGYSAGPLTRRTDQRVYVPLFENRTWYRDIEIDLTRQVVKELASRPGISIAPQERADIVLAGTIVDYAQQVLSEDKNNQVRESSIVTRVRIDVKDARTGAVRRSYESRDREAFLADRGETLTSATLESFADLSRYIVDGLEDDFPSATE